MEWGESTFLSRNITRWKLSRFVFYQHFGNIATILQKPIIESRLVSLIAVFFSEGSYSFLMSHAFSFIYLFICKALFEIKSAFESSRRALSAFRLLVIGDNCIVELLFFKTLFLLLLLLLNLSDLLHFSTSLEKRFEHRSLISHE